MDQRPIASTPAANPWKPIAGLVVILFVATLIGGWLYVESVRNDLEMKLEALEPAPVGMPAAQPQPAPAPVSAADDLMFDPASVSVGDRIGQWTVSRIENNGAGDPRRVHLEGTATVHGTYTKHLDDSPFFSGWITFETDEAAAAVIPRLSVWNEIEPTHGTYRFFAFEANAAARQAFDSPGDTGQASIVLRDYVVNVNLESEAFDTADFVRRTDR